MERLLWGMCCLLPKKSQRLVFELSAEAIGTCVQEDRLWIADPRAINHILQKSGYLYAKPSDIQEQAALFNDRGIGSVEGELSSAISYIS